MSLELSSNWKKLQASLQPTSSTTSSGAKRKAPPTQRQRDTAAKRRRLEETSVSGRGRKLRGVSRRESAGEDARRTKKMGSWVSTARVSAAHQQQQCQEDTREGESESESESEMESEAVGMRTKTSTTSMKTTTTITTKSKAKTKPQLISRPPSSSLPLWALEHDISSSDLAAAYGPTLGLASSLPSSTSLSSSHRSLSSHDLINNGLNTAVPIGKYISLDCEMVGVGAPPYTQSCLARVSLVNYHGVQIYDSYVRPTEHVHDWRTPVSGISPRHMAHARSFAQAQGDVAALLAGRVLVGHALRNDLEVLMLGHPKRDVRDTARLKAYRKLVGGRTPSLKVLARVVLGVDVQGGEHSSVEDARVAMALFRRGRREFEEEGRRRWGGEGKGVGEGEEEKNAVAKVKAKPKKGKAKKKKGKR